MASISYDLSKAVDNIKELIKNHAILAGIISGLVVFILLGKAEEVSRLWVIIAAAVLAGFIAIITYIIVKNICNYYLFKSKVPLRFTADKIPYQILIGKKYFFVSIAAILMSRHERDDELMLVFWALRDILKNGDTLAKNVCDVGMSLDQDSVIFIRAQFEQLNLIELDYYQDMFDKIVPVWILTKKGKEIYLKTKHNYKEKVALRKI